MPESVMRSRGSVIMVMVIPPGKLAGPEEVVAENTYNSRVGYRGDAYLSWPLEVLSQCKLWFLPEIFSGKFPMKLWPVRILTKLWSKLNVKRKWIFMVCSICSWYQTSFVSSQMQCWLLITETSTFFKTLPRCCLTWRCLGSDALPPQTVLS